MSTTTAPALTLEYVTELQNTCADAYAAMKEENTPEHRAAHAAALGRATTARRRYELDQALLAKLAQSNSGGRWHR